VAAEPLGCQISFVHEGGMHGSETI